MTDVTFARPTAVATPQALDVEALLKSIALPPRPELLTKVQAEMAAGDPDPARISRLIGMDVAMTAAVLRTVNSPFYALAKSASTVDQAISLLGMRQIATLVTAFALRQAIKGEAAKLTRFWDVSTKRSYALSRLARGLGGVDPDAGHNFGLFCDVGIPLLMQRFPDYGSTLKAANEEASAAFTSVEQAAHHTDHGLIGALMARSWGLPRVVSDAIRQHHDYGLFNDRGADEQVVRLIAMALVAELSIQRFARLNASMEWTKGGEEAASVLALDSAGLEDWIDDLIQGFASGVA